MQWLPYIAGAAVVLWLYVQLRGALIGKLQQGKQAPELAFALEAGLDVERPLLVFIYSRHCGQCAAMAPIIDALVPRFGNVLKLDIEKHPTLTRRLGAVSTPTVVLVRDGLIRKVMVGPRSERQLERLFV